MGPLPSPVPSRVRTAALHALPAQSRHLWGARRGESGEEGGPRPRHHRAPGVTCPPLEPLGPACRARAGECLCWAVTHSRLQLRTQLSLPRVLLMMVCHRSPESGASGLVERGSGVLCDGVWCFHVWARTCASTDSSRRAVCEDRLQQTCCVLQTTPSLLLMVKLCFLKYFELMSSSRSASASTKGYAGTPPCPLLCSHTRTRTHMCTRTRACPFTSQSRFFLRQQ